MRAAKWMFITLAAVATVQAAPAAPPADVCGAHARRAHLDFTLRDVHGREVALSRFRGDVVLINFWATWCAPCRAEIPQLDALYQKYRARGLVILGVSVDDPASRLAPFVAKLDVRYPVLIGAEQEDFLEAFGPLAGFPTSVLISRDGSVCAQHAGLLDQADLERRIRALL